MILRTIGDRNKEFVWGVLLCLSLILVVSAVGETCDFIGIRSSGLGCVGIAVPGIEGSASNPAAIYPGCSNAARLGVRCGDGLEAIYGMVYEPDSGLGAGSLAWYRERAGMPRRKRVSYNWATRIGSRAFFGTSITWKNCEHEDERLSGKSVLVDFGTLLFLQDDVAVGFSTENLCTLYQSGGRLDTGWSVGIAFRPAADAMVALDLVELGDLKVRLSSEYQVASNLAVRLGLCKSLEIEEAETWTAGVGYQGHCVCVNYAVSTDGQDIIHGIEFGINLL